MIVTLQATTLLPAKSRPTLWGRSHFLKARPIPLLITVLILPVPLTFYNRLLVTADRVLMAVINGEMLLIGYVDEVSSDSGNFSSRIHPATEVSGISSLGGFPAGVCENFYLLRRELPNRRFGKSGKTTPLFDGEKLCGRQANWSPETSRLSQCIDSQRLPATTAVFILVLAAGRLRLARYVQDRARVEKSCN